MPEIAKPARARAAKKRVPMGQDEVRRAVLKAARELFASRPYGDVTTRSVAAAANVNLGLLHRHFGSKESILNAVIEEDAALHLRRMTDHPSAGARLLSLFDDQSARQSVRLMAHLVMSNISVASYVVPNGPLSRLMASGEPVDANASQVPLGVDILTAFSLLMGWTLFEDFILEAAGGKITRDDLRLRVMQVARAVSESSLDARAGPGRRRLESPSR